MKQILRGFFYLFFIKKALKFLRNGFYAKNFTDFIHFTTNSIVYEEVSPVKLHRNRLCISKLL